MPDTNFDFSVKSTNLNSTCKSCPLKNSCSSAFIQKDKDCQDIKFKKNEVLLVYLIVFILPLIFMFLGGFIARFYKFNQVIGIFIGLLMAFIVINLLDKFVRRRKNNG